MAAAAYKVSLTVENSKGQRKNFYLTASDVNAAYWLGPDGSSDIIISTKESGVIVDVLYSAAGTDTSNVSIFKNSFDTGLKFLNAANTGSILSRQSQSMRIPFAPGDKFRFLQNT